MTKKKLKKDLLLEKHGMTDTAEYIVWRNMISRCYNHKDCSYHRYGGRGVSVCYRWKKSAACFLKDMGKRPSAKYSLDRIDCNQNYKPSNCRWATSKQQAINRRIPEKKSGLPIGVRRYWRNPDKFHSKIKINGHPYVVGTYDTVEEAKLEFDKIYFEWYGKKPSSYQ